jgi:hypothetical protein
MKWQLVKHLPILVLALFTSCKKYPENNLWFSSPERSFKGGKITSFTVNGADSSSLMNSMWNVDIAERSFEVKRRSENEYVASGDFNGVINYLGKTQLNIILIPDNMGAFSTSGNYNPINSNGVSADRSDGRWDILKCTRKGQMKIRRTVNDRTYEIQFN